MEAAAETLVKSRKKDILKFYKSCKKDALKMIKRWMLVVCKLIALCSLP